MPDSNEADDSTSERRNFLKLLGVAGAGSIAGCSGGGGGGGTDTSTGTGTSASTATDGTGGGSNESGGGSTTDLSQWIQEASQPYEGQSITLVTESTPPSLFYQENAVGQFQDLTGISVDFQAVAFSEMSNRIVSNATSNQPGIDIAYTEQDSLTAYASNEWLINLTQFRNQNPDLAMPGFNIDDFVAFGENFRFPTGEDYYAYPMEAFLKTFVYRQDIYDNQEMSSAYQEQFGQEFTAPTNPQQYMQSAQFIYENSESILGQQIAGHAAQVQAETGPYAMVETYFPIHGVYNWGINLEDFTALASRNGTMNSQSAIEAMDFYRELLQYAPEGVRSYTWSGPPDAIISGAAAQGMVYSENLGNMVNADLGYEPSALDVALPPAEDGVIEAARNGEGYVGYFDGGGYGIMSASNNPEPAYLFLQWMIRPDLQEQLAQDVGAITRVSAIEPARGQLINEATGYVDFYEEDQELFKGNPVGRVQATLINEVFIPVFQNFVAGNISAEVCANRWAYQTEQLLAEVGFLDEAGEQPSPY
jgi:multiple sugar transport system substrate-binding protein